MSADSLPRRFRSLFRARLVSLAVALAANLLLLFGLLDLEQSLITFAAGTSVYAVLTVLWWRCPSCGRYPGNSVMPDLCEHCGAELFGHDKQIVHIEPAAADNPQRTITHLLAIRFLYGAGLVALFAVWGPHMDRAPVLFWGVTLASMAMGAWGEWKWWRCPHCGGYLRRNLWPGRTCGKCGGKLV